jgi:hypothetical protein
MAERALSMSGSGAPETPTLVLARHLRLLGKSVVNVREDILRGRGSQLRDLGLIGDALRELQLRGLVRPTERLRSGSGRPTQDWLIHPALLGH